jgi:hypothetical protein
MQKHQINKKKYKYYIHTIRISFAEPLNLEPVIS